MLRILFFLILSFKDTHQLESKGFCPAFESSPHYRTPTRQVQADPTNWIALIEQAKDGDEILLADGHYLIDKYAIVISAQITIRSASGDRSSVLIEGAGYGTPGEGFMVAAPQISIADLTITGIRNHGISIKGEFGADATRIYNVHLYDIGTQHIKGTPGTRDGVVACSRIGYTASGVQGDYINGIDIHGAVNWLIRDNELYNIWGDGSGCEVDVDCGRYQFGGGPAILLWNNAGYNRVLRNRMVNCYRGIALGFADNHPGGRVQNNFFVQTVPEQNGIPGDAGISIRGTGVLIDHNTVILGGRYRGAVEVQNSARLKIRNNLLSAPVWNRGRSTYLDQGNISNATVHDLESAVFPLLKPTSAAIDPPFSTQVEDIETDIEGDPRCLGATPDAGCDEAAANSARRQ